MLGFNGGLLGVRRVPTLSAANGLWFPNEQSVAKRENSWPVLGLYRYWRFANFANTVLNSGTLDLVEIELSDANGLITGVTASASFSWTAGSSSLLVDGIKSSLSRAYNQSWATSQPTATISFDFSTPKNLTSLQIFSIYQQPRFPASFDLQYSTDGSFYVTYSTVTVGTSFTDLGDAVFASAVISIP